MNIVPRKSTDQGGYLMMPLIKNIPVPKKAWKRMTCPACGQECWGRPLPAEFRTTHIDGSLCTECALRAAVKEDKRK